MILHNRLIPFGTYKAINLLGIIFTKMPLTHAELRHEQIHTRQMLEMLVIGFYLWYIVEWLIRCPRKGNAYRRISFEREAYAHEHDLQYLQHRKPFAWWRYL